MGVSAQSVPLAGIGPGVSASADAPPAVLPGEHFALASVCLLAGAAGVVWIAPELAAGAFLAPRVVAVVHLFTLGFLTTSIFGALYQFLPVALGVSVWSQRAAHASFALLLVGVPCFAAGLALGIRHAVHAGATAAALALLIAAGNLLLTLRAAETRDVTWWALLGAALAIVITLSLGLAMAILGSAGLGLPALTVLGVHVHLALAGFVLLVVVAVARHLLPMFLLSHGAPAWPARAAASLLAAGCASLALPLLGMGFWIPALLLGAGVAAIVVMGALFHRHRVRKTLDAGMRLARAGMAGLVVTVLVGLSVLVADAAEPRLLTVYGVLALGSLSLFVTGHYYKIVPFLIWFHRYGSGLGKGKVPRVADLVSARLARIAGVLLVAGVAGVVVGIGAGLPQMVQAGGAALLAGAAIQSGQLVSALTRRLA